jgi:hypothetical protein
MKNKKEKGDFKSPKEINSPSDKKPPLYLEDEPEDEKIEQSEFDSENIQSNDSEDENLKTDQRLQT